MEEIQKEELRFPNFIERYTTQHFVPNIDDEEFKDQYMFDHSNGLVIMGIAKCHPVCKAKNIQVVQKIGKGEKRQVKGKHKSNAFKLRSRTIIMEIIADEKTYPIYAGCSGKLIEINENVMNNPQLLIEESEGNGFLAIIQRSTTGKIDEMKMMNLNDYCVLRGREIPKYIDLPMANEEYDIDDYS